MSGEITAFYLPRVNHPLDIRRINVKNSFFADSILDISCFWSKEDILSRLARRFPWITGMAK